MARSETNDLIDEVESILSDLSDTGRITPIKVKSMLEHLRSSLEYLSNDIFTKYNPGKIAPDRLYFPYGKKQFVDNYFKKIGINTPSDSELYSTITSIQDYYTRENWLSMLCNLTNEVKHRGPIKLHNHETITEHKIFAGNHELVRATNVGSIKVSIGTIEINGKKTTNLKYDNGKLETSTSEIPINIVLTKNNKIKFHGLEYEVEPFIKSCAGNLRKMINKCYDILEEH
ncbi:TPA: hypothetical protein M8J25_003317 [Enterobacter cloacae]|nr:hypothetical protein [Enterobacter cloacae]